MYIYVEECTLSSHEQASSMAVDEWVWNICGQVGPQAYRSVNDLDLSDAKCPLTLLCSKSTAIPVMKTHNMHFRICVHMHGLISTILF